MGIVKFRFNGPIPLFDSPLKPPANVALTCIGATILNKSEVTASSHCQVTWNSLLYTATSQANYICRYPYILLWLSVSIVYLDFGQFWNWAPMGPTFWRGSNRMYAQWLLHFAKGVLFEEADNMIESTSHNESCVSSKFSQERQLFAVIACGLESSSSLLHDDGESWESYQRVTEGWSSIQYKGPR